MSVEGQSAPSRTPYLKIAVYFLRLGAVGFGGPIALAARMRQDLVDTRKLISAEDYAEGLAFSQVAPGPLAAQLAMYLGYVMGGLAGCTAAGLAFVAPSFLIVVAISVAYVSSSGLAVVQALFRGIAPVVVAIIAVAAWRLSSKMIRRDPLLVGICAVVAVWTVVYQRELAVLFIGCGVAGMLIRGRNTVIKARVAAIPGLAVAASTGGLVGLGLFFLKAGLFVFGSGLAIVPFLYSGLVQQHHWLTEQQFVDAVAIAMITPGPVVITVAFIGYLIAGLKGALVAALGVFAPVYLMVVFLAPAYRRYSQVASVRAFVSGVTAAACGGIAGSAIVLSRRSIHDVAGAALAATTLLLLVRWKIPEPLLIAAGGVIGIVSAYRA